MHKFSAKDYNFVAKRLRENFPLVLCPDEEYYAKQKEKVLLQQGMVTLLALDFAKKYREDNPSFDPLAFLDQCSPDVDKYPLSELWEGNVHSS